MSVPIGQKLRQAREEQERTLEEVALNTRIRLSYLQAMEEGNFEALPTPFQQRGFLRSYAGYLGLDPTPLLEALETGYKLVPKTPAPSEQARPEETEPTPNEFESIGEKLARQRNLLGFSLEDVERQIHVKPHYLQAIEEGRLDELPSSVQGRGMLHNYATCLGLDSEPLLLVFAEELQVRLEKKRSQEERPSHADTELQRPSWAKRVFSQHLLVSGAFALILGVVIVWSGAQVMRQRAEEAQVTAAIPGVADVLLPSATPSPTAEPSLTPQTGLQVNVDKTSTPVPEEGEGEAEITPVPAEEGEIQVQLVIEYRAWVRVIADGEVVFSGRMLPGSTHVFGGEERVEILTGNAAGVRVFYNQNEIGVLGVYGAVANLIFTVEGILTPTPTITPTLVDTLTPTPTSTSTATPTLTD